MPSVRAGMVGIVAPYTVVLYRIVQVLSIWINGSACPCRQ